MRFQKALLGPRRRTEPLKKKSRGRYLGILNNILEIFLLADYCWGAAGKP